MMYVTVSKPRCGCHEVPLGSPGAYSTSPIWSMWMNGSRSRRSTPANARRTGKPSPSTPDGAVVTERTRRRTVPGAGRGTRGRTVVSSTVTAGMPASRVESSTSTDCSAAGPGCVPVRRADRELDPRYDDEDPLRTQRQLRLVEAQPAVALDRAPEPARPSRHTGAH